MTTIYSQLTGLPVKFRLSENEADDYLATHDNCFFIERDSDTTYRELDFNCGIFPPSWFKVGGSR